MLIVRPFGVLNDLASLVDNNTVGCLEDSVMELTTLTDSLLASTQIVLREREQGAPECRFP